MHPNVIYEDADMLGIYKPSGLLMHHIANAPGREPTLTDWLLAHYPETATVGDDPALRPGVVHRLDRDTSGIVLVARSQEAFGYLKGQFQKHLVRKTYLALVAGEPSPAAGVIAKPIGIRPGTTRRSVHSTKMQKEAVTEYATLAVFKLPASDPTPYTLHPLRRGSGQATRFSLLSVSPKTGRTHQIRVHLASIGHPIIGDTLYAKKKKAVIIPRLMLHAYRLEFSAPSGKALRLEAPPDETFLRGLRAAGSDPAVIHREGEGIGYIMLIYKRSKVPDHFPRIFL